MSTAVKTPKLETFNIITWRPGLNCAQIRADNPFWVGREALYCPNPDCWFVGVAPDEYCDLCDERLYGDGKIDRTGLQVYRINEVASPCSKCVATTSEERAAKLLGVSVADLRIRAVVGEVLEFALATPDTVYCKGCEDVADGSLFEMVVGQ